MTRVVAGSLCDSHGCSRVFIYIFTPFWCNSIWTPGKVFRVVKNPELTLKRAYKFKWHYLFFCPTSFYFQTSRLMHNTLLCIEYWQNILFTSENRCVCARHAPNILDMRKWRQLTKRTVLFSTKPQQALLGSLKTHLYMKGHRLSNKKNNSEEPLRAPKIFTYGTKSWLFKSPVKVSAYIPFMRISYGQDSEKGLREHNNYSCMLNSPKSHPLTP